MPFEPFHLPALIWTVAVLVVWLGFALACRVIAQAPRSDEEGVGGGIDIGLALIAAKIYARTLHRLKVVGRVNIPRTLTPGPLIVVANHTAGIDPILIQVACPFEVRWMMAAEMQVAFAAPLWAWLRVIAVRQSRHDARAALEAIRHLRHGSSPDSGGGVLGVFPEGGIERPRGLLRPFLPGVGTLAAKSGAAVLPVIISGTPVSTTAWGSLLRPSSATLTFLPIIRCPENAGAADMNQAIRSVFEAHMPVSPDQGVRIASAASRSSVC